MNRNELDVVILQVLRNWNGNITDKSYGSFDRNYWHYKTLTSFPSATFQQVVAGLSVLIKSNLSPKHCSNLYLTEVTRSAMMYWAAIQNADGSFNEYYKNDSSFCPTAFTALANAIAFKNISHLIPQDNVVYIEHALHKAANWLASNDYPDVGNQTIAAFAAILCIADATKKLDMYEKILKNKFKKMQKIQCDEGWFPEYGGLDLGYSFIALDLLAVIQSQIRNFKLFNIEKKLINFLAKNLPPNGLLPPLLSSRGTTHVTPFGINFFARDGNKKSQYIYSWYKKKSCLDVNLRCDEKYLNYFYFNSIVFTYELQKSNFSKTSFVDQANNFSKKLTEKSSTNLFKESGIFIYSDKKITIFVGIKNSGAIYLYSGDQLKLIHGGISFFEGKNIFTSTYIDPASNFFLKKEKNNIELNIKTRFAKYADRKILDRYGFLVHIFSHFVLKFPFMKKVTVPIKRYLVSKRVFSNYSLSRNIRISNDQVRISNNLELEGSKFSKIKVIVHKASHLIYSPSSRMSDSIYFEHDVLLDLNVIDKKVNYTTTFIIP